MFSYVCLELVLGRISKLFRFNNYPLGEKAYSVMFHIAGLSFRDFSERYLVTMASRGSVRRWFHRFSRIFSAEIQFKDTVKRLSVYLKRRLGHSTTLWKIVHQHEMTRNLFTIIKKLKEEY